VALAFLPVFLELEARALRFGPPLWAPAKADPADALRQD
jgi:hypothetical protein